MGRYMGVRLLLWALWVSAGGRSASGECMGVGEGGGGALMIPGDAILTLIIPIHYGPNCSQVGLREVQIAEAIQMAVQKINEASMIPGVTIGLRVIDTCGIPSFTTKMAAVSWVQDSLSCPKPALTLAVLGPDDATSASSVGVIMNSLGVSVLAYGPRYVTAPPSLDIVTPAPYHTAQAAVQVLTGAGISGVSVVHTDDAEGLVLSQHFVDAAEYWYVCVDQVLSGANSNLMNKISTGPGAVVVLGSRHKVQFLARTLGQPDSPVGLLLLAEGGPLPQVELGGISTPSVVLQRQGPVLPEFLTFLQRDLATDDTPRRHYLEAAGACESCADDFFGYDAAVPSAVDAVLRSVAALKEAHLTRCGGKKGICSEIYGLGVDKWHELILSSTLDMNIFPDLTPVTPGTEDAPLFTVKLLFGGNLTQVGQADVNSAVLGEIDLPELKCGDSCPCDKEINTPLGPQSNFTHSFSGFNILTGSNFWNWQLTPIENASPSELTVYITAFSMVILLLLLSAMVCTYNIVRPPPRQ